MYTRSSIIQSHLTKIGLYIDKKYQMTNNIVKIQKGVCGMVFSKKMISSIIVIISLGYAYFQFEAVRAVQNTASATLLPTTGDKISIWPIVVGVFLVLVAIVLFLKKKI